ncbi:MAG: xanthine dehydrogenase family protein subunit M [Treponema sp.]|jgi:carbon-monoxide dehydrogenase medium subunit|nr:xanthine dehydrogenase family protein subunit M [Treponema sp.]
MVLPNFEYLAPKSLDEACELLAKLGSGAKVMAGATDLIPPMKDKVLSPTHLIDIKRISGLDQLEFDPSRGFTIGALTTLRTIETSPLVKEKNPAVAHAAKVVASTQIRAKGTMTGNICNASPSCDTGPILIVEGAKVYVQGPGGNRVIPIEEFFVGVKKTSLQPGEIVTAIEVPPLGPNERAAYKKHAVRKAMDLAIVGVAAKIKVEKGICTDAKIALGAVAIKPIRSPAAEKILIGKKLTDEVIAEASVAAMESCNPISDVRASDIYRKDMIRVFTKRAVKQALDSF